MENATYLALSRQMALQTDMDTIANNIANISTPGYRATGTMFHEQIMRLQNGADSLSFTSDEGQYFDTRPGSIKSTQNPLDIALAGPGFIAVENTGGQTVYTRAGNLQIGTDQTLQTSTGYKLDGGITIPATSEYIKISETGGVFNQDGQIGQIKIVEFRNTQNMKPIGDNLYTSTEAEIQAQNTRIKQGHLEGSNVQPVVEITRMIETSRSFQTTQNLLQSENERLRSSIRKLTEQG